MERSSPELEKVVREMVDAMQASDIPARDSTPDQGDHITVTLDDVHGYEEAP
jgi:hypothetical protein